jgi:predicted nicotinamide N-methyase
MMKDSEKFDVIITSDTLYSTQSQKDLYYIIEDQLKTNGVAYPSLYLKIIISSLTLKTRYVAAKSYYFGKKLSEMIGR